MRCTADAKVTHATPQHTPLHRGARRRSRSLLQVGRGSRRRYRCADGDRRILIEINITSNVQTRVVPAPSAHPVRDFYDRGLNVTLCTDSWLMCGTTLTNEYLLAHTELGFTRPEIDRMILNGFESAFVEWPIRERLIASARRELAAL